MIVDDHQAIIEMMTHVVDSIAGHRVVGAAKDAKEALGIAERERPDVLILDLVMPQFSGFFLLKELRKVSCSARVLIFSGNLSPVSIREGLAAGVFGFVEKAAPLQEFRTAILAVGAGQVYFDPKTSRVVHGLVNRNHEGPTVGPDLTEREKTVLRLMALGQSSKEIAERLDISVHTVINHRSNLMKKTGLRRVAQLSLYAVQAGLIGGLDDSVNSHN
ncbi:MAG TPA: response regulator transcription factor [Roseimicrobium sp.]|nr:response regulator transcription factor [Roseimicrobium sp.]